MKTEMQTIKSRVIYGSETQTMPIKCPKFTSY